MNTEFRELDAWIAEHVMGWLFNRHGLAFSPHPNDKWEKESIVPRYTTDPAAAMSVLEKCAERLSEAGEEYAVAIERIGNEWRVLQTDVFNGPEAKAHTLPLAIAKFAKVLYSK